MSDSRTSEFIERIPVGPLALMPLQSIETLGERVNRYLAAWRAERESEHKHTIAFNGYQKDNYIVPTKISRFGTGEAKGEILETVRGVDIYFLGPCESYVTGRSLRGSEEADRGDHREGEADQCHHALYV